VRRGRVGGRKGEERKGQRNNPIYHPTYAYLNCITCILYKTYTG
jgi:hypothetical protein